MCASVYVHVVRRGQDSTSVFGHGAGPVAKGVSRLQRGLPVESSRQSLSHTSLLQTAHIFSPSFL